MKGRIARLIEGIGVYLPEENPVPAYRNPWNIALAVAIVAVVIIAAFIVFQPTDNPDGGGHTTPGTLNVQISVLSAKWEELSLEDIAPEPGMQYLWTEVNLTNGLDDPLPIIAIAFSAQGNDGSKFNATDADFSGEINPGATDSFNLSFKVPTSWYPKKAFLTLLKQSTSATIPSPALLVPDISITITDHKTNKTDQNNQNYTNNNVFHLWFDFKNQWTENTLTDATHFNITDVAGTSVPVLLMTGQTTVQPNATAHFALDFLVPLGYVPKTLNFAMQPGPYANVAL